MKIPLLVKEGAGTRIQNELHSTFVRRYTALVQPPVTKLCSSNFDENPSWSEILLQSILAVEQLDLNHQRSGLVKIISKLISGAESEAWAVENFDSVVQKLKLMAHRWLDECIATLNLEF